MLALTKGDGIEQSEEVLLEFVDIQEEILKDLGLKYRVLDMASEELGAAAFRKYDIEAWIPSKQDYGEVCSASNCTNYQARRLNICYLGDKNQKTLVHTVNATALAVPRILLCLIETYYDHESDSIVLPPAIANLVPFKRIEASKAHESVIHK